jgi:hypothetical protein
MTVPSPSRSRLPPRAFQFRLATLLIAILWAALISLGLRSPTALWSGMIAVLTLLTVLMAILVIIYRTGRTRAMAIGFAVFGIGYLVYIAILAGTLSSGLTDPTTPVGGAFNLLYDVIHPEQPSRIRGSGMGGMAGMGSGMGGYITSDPFADPFAAAPTPPPPQAPIYDRRDFIAICNQALACLLGIAGAIAAQMLFASRKEDS